MNPKQFEELKERILRMTKDKDKLRLMEPAIQSGPIDLGQAIELHKMLDYGEGQLKAVLLCKSSMPAADFEKLVQSLPYEEDRIQARKFL